MRMDYLCGHWVCVCFSLSHIHTHWETRKESKSRRIECQNEWGKEEKKLWHEWFVIMQYTYYPASYVFQAYTAWVPHAFHSTLYKCMFVWKTHHHESFMECNVITNDLKCNAPNARAHSFAWYFFFTVFWPYQRIHTYNYNTAICICWQRGM